MTRDLVAVSLRTPISVVRSNTWYPNRTEVEVLQNGATNQEELFRSHESIMLGILFVLVGEEEARHTASIILKEHNVKIIAQEQGREKLIQRNALSTKIKTQFNPDPYVPRSPTPDPCHIPYPVVHPHQRPYKLTAAQFQNHPFFAGFLLSPRSSPEVSLRESGDELASLAENASSISDVSST